MARLENYELEELKKLALSHGDIHNIISDKTDTIDKLNHNQKSSYFEPQPTLTPNDNLNFPKEKQLSDEFKKSQKDNINQTRENFDKKIEQEARNNVKELGHEYQNEQMDSLDREDIITLLEKNGVDKLQDRLKEKEQEQSKQAVQKEDKKDLVTQMDEKESRDFWQENKSDIEQSKNEKDLDVTQNQDDKTLDTIQLDEEQYDDLMSNSNYIDIEEKDIDVDMDKLPPEPSDNYE